MARARTTKKAAAVRRQRETTRVTKKQESSSFLDYFRLTESYASLLLGIVVVIIAALLLVSFIRNKNIANFTNTKKEISATKTVNQQNQPTITQNQNLSNTTPGGTYTIQAGDDLWKIAEKTYHDGFKWTEIAKANHITNPSMISAGQKLTLPKLETAVAQTITPTPTPTTVQTTQQSTNSSVPASQKITGMTYTVVRGDYLWEIAVRAYGDGYKWVDIAHANNLANPDIIHSGNVLKLPR